MTECSKKAHITIGSLYYMYILPGKHSEQYVYVCLDININTCSTIPYAIMPSLQYYSKIFSPSES